MAVVRFAGPFGPALVRVIFKKRVSWLPETNAIRQGRIDFDQLCAYTYQNWAGKPSGEYAMLSHLYPVRTLLAFFDVTEFSCLNIFS